MIFVFAPKGRRIVATGGAEPAARRAQRNPWSSEEAFVLAPEGRRKPAQFLRPSRTDSSECDSFSTGCAPPARLPAGCASPVATVRRPCLGEAPTADPAG